MTVAVVGPAPPDRGGIAHQTSLLAKNLGSNLSVYLTFSRPYPKMLNPRRFNQSQSTGEVASPPARKMFDWASPGSWRQTARAVTESGAEALIVPWWTSFWSLPVRALLREIGKSRPRLRSFLLCHNVVEHESALWKRVLSSGAFGAASGFIVHSEEDRRYLERRFAPRSLLLLPHPVEERPRPDRELARRRLAVSSPLVLFLGLVRRYKGADLLIDAAPRICAETGATIALVGEVFPDARFVPEMAAHSRAAGSLRLVDRYVTEEEMDEWLAACDVVVCPYRRISGSGIAARALAARRPVVAADLPGFRMVLDDETGKFFPAGDSTALADAVIEVVRRGAGSYEPALCAAAARASWPAYAEAIARFCRL